MSTTIENFILRFKTEGDRDFKRIQGDIGGLQSGLKGLAGDANKATQSLNGVAKAGKNVGSSKNGLKGLKDDALGAAQGMGGLAGNLAGMGARLGPIGAAVGAVAAVTVGLAASAVSAGDALYDLSQATGVSASQLMSLQASMVLAGGKSDSYEKAVAKLNLQIGEAVSGNKSAIETFKQLGVEFASANGKVRPTGEILAEVVEKLKGVEDTSIRAQIAVALMGKEMSRIDSSELEATGNAITDAEIAKLAEFQNRIDQLQLSLSQGNTKFWGSMLLQMDEVYNKMADLVAKYPAIGGAMVKGAGAVGGLPGMIIAKGVEQQLNADGSKLGGSTGPGRRGKGVQVTIRPEPEKPKTSTSSTGSTRTGPSEAQQQALRAQEALATSQRKILTATAQYEIKLARNNGDEVAAIALQRDLDIAEATRDIQDNSLLSLSQKNSEIAAVTKNIRLDAEQDILDVQKRQRDVQDDLLDRVRDITASYSDYLKDQVATVGMTNRERDRYYYQKELAEAQSAALEEQNKLIKTQDTQWADLSATAEGGIFQALDKAVTDTAKSTANALAFGEAIKNIPPLPVMKGPVMPEIPQTENETQIKLNEEYLESWRAGVEAVQGQYKDMYTEVNVAADQTSSLFGNMENAIDEFVQTGKFKFSDFAKSVIRDLIAIQMKAQMVKLLNMGLSAIFGGSSGGLGMGSSGASGFGFGGGGGGPVGLPGMAVGGNTRANTPYMVGERGPEMFVPSSSGKIVANNALSTGNNATNQPLMQTTNVNYNIQAVDALSFRQMVSRDPEFLYSVTETGRRRQPNKGR